MCLFVCVRNDRYLYIYHCVLKETEIKTWFGTPRGEFDWRFKLRSMNTRVFFNVLILQWLPYGTPACLYNYSF